MTHIRPVQRAALRFTPFSLFLSVLLLLAGPARAQDPFADTSPDKGSGTKPTEGVRGETHQSLPRPKVAEPDEPPPVGPVERLPPTAYPEWQTRGIYGGSLWLTFHGMPWPYYPKTGIGISGSAWMDTGYEQVDRGTSMMTEPSQVKYLLQQGRGLVRVTPTYSNGPWYVQAQAELVANKDQTISQAQGVVDVDDLWIRAGKWKSWDVQVGRFEGFEVYHFGMGLDLNTLERRGAFDEIRGLPDVAGFNNGYLRPPNVGNVALHMYFTNLIRIELLGQVGSEGGLNTGGTRPALVVDFGWLKLKGAANYHRQWAITNSSQEKRESKGGMAAIQFVLAPFAEFGLNFDYGYVDHFSPSVTMLPDGSSSNYDRLGSTTTVSYGGFANARVVTDLLVGIGANYITQHDVFPDATTGEFGRFNHLQAFGAVQYLIARGLFLKVVGGYARAHLEPSTSGTMPIMPWDNSMVSGRVRLLYLF